MNDIKVHRVVGLMAISVLGVAVLILVASASLAGEQSPASAPQEKSESLPALSGTFTEDTLTIAWPKSAMNWILSTQSIDARTWSFVPAAQYGTNETDIYFKTPLPAKTTFCRLLKVSPGMRNRIGQYNQPTQPPPRPLAPKPVTRLRPAGAPPAKP